MAGKHQKAVNPCNLQPQPSEQEGVYIGVGPCAGDFDLYLYEDFGFHFLEGDIPTEDFRKKRTDEEIRECIHHLGLMRDACIRTIAKLEQVLLVEKE